jgi:hypothetical protein
MGGAWVASLAPDGQTDTQARERVADAIQAELARRIETAPTAECFTWTAPPFWRVEARRVGTNRAAPLTVRLLDLPAVGNGRRPAAALPSDPGGQEALLAVAVALPDPGLAGLGARLVGLDGIRAEVLAACEARWDGAWEAWAARNNTVVPRALAAYATGSPAVFHFHGDGGTGKSSLAGAVCDGYARAHDTTGQLVRVGTEVRGNGLVGSFSANIRAAFSFLLDAPDDGTLRALIIDEIDGIAVHRGEGTSHQEDRAATATLLQATDALARAGRPRTAVFLTSNRPGALDPALRRRCALEVAFPRPDEAARRTILAAWLPGAPDRELARAARAAVGMTACDIERALSRCYGAVLQSGGPVNVGAVAGVLRREPRTGRV